MEPDIFSSMLPLTGNVGNYANMGMYGQTPSSLNLADIVKPRNLVGNSASLLNGGSGTPFGFTPGAGAPGFMDSDFMKNMLGYKAADGTQHMGWGGMALGAGQALFGAWDGMRNYNLQKDQLAFSKDAFAKNWDAQRKTTNSQLQDRQQARLASREGASSNPYQSVGDYMKQNGIA